MITSFAKAFRSFPFSRDLKFFAANNQPDKPLGAFLAYKESASTWYCAQMGMARGKENILWRYRLYFSDHSQADVLCHDTNENRTSDFV